MTQWTDELKAKVIEMYEGADPTPETSTEIIKDIADEIEASPNGVRMVLVQAGVYVKKKPLVVLQNPVVLNPLAKAPSVLAKRVPLPNFGKLLKAKVLLLMTTFLAN